MTVQVSYPGVYIDEFAPGAPIQGVGTGTAAFVGVAANGDLDLPTKITSWEAFKSTFGQFPVPGFHLWYAVRGFFENGGQVCYVVRASNGSYEELPLSDRAGNDIIRVRSRQPGNLGINVEVSLGSLLDENDTEIYQPTGPYATLTERTITMDAIDEDTTAEVVAARFRPGDWVTLGSGGERVRVLRVTAEDILLEAAFAGTYTPGTDNLRLADAPAGQQSLRLRYAPNNTTAHVPTRSLIAGTVLTLDPSGANEAHVVDSVQVEYFAEGPTYRVTFRDGLYAPLGMGSAVAVRSEEFDIVVSLDGSSQTYANLSLDSAHDRHFLSVVNQDPAGLVHLASIEPPPPDGLPGSLPDAMNATALENGQDESLADIEAADFIEALATLEAIDDVNLIAVPDAAGAAVQQAVIQQCEQLADRFAVLDTQAGLKLFSTGDSDSVEEQRRTLDSARGYGALYFPWLRVMPAGSGDPILVPPSGHVCGIIARSDAKRGVHKAPANEILAGALGLEQTLSNVDQGQLNLQGINVIRRFGGGRPTLWGARTTATDTNWQYVNIRRLFLFVEESIQKGIAWAVFEPNNLQLWQKLKRTIGEFLNRVWRDGGLFGATPEEAYYIKIDETNNPFSEQALGRLHIEIGLRPSYPAEFIVLRIGIWPGGAEISES